MKNSVAAAADSAATPPTGWRRVIFEPIVLTIRQPPLNVPRPIAVWAARTTQSGTSDPTGRCPLPMRTARMTPIVFCASLPPWPRLNAAADTSWAWRKPRLSRSTLRWRWTAHITAIITTVASASPSSGDSRMNTPIFCNPLEISTSKPPLATAAPAMPPTRACDELVGRPR